MQTTPYTGSGTSMEQTAEKSMQQVRQRMSDVNERIISFIKERPTTCLLGAVAAGFVIGRLVSRR